MLPFRATAVAFLAFTSARLGRIATAMKADIDHGLFPGAVVAIARKGKLVYYESFGYVDKASGAIMPKDAIFPVASMTKPMTAAGVMSLNGMLFATA